jgi:16S rRNA processing protein RimM
VINTVGEHLGRIDRLMETGADDVLVVVDASAAADKPVERLIPFVSAVVKDVDRDAAVVRVEWDAQW